jgi:hypothetical protein
VSKIFRVNLFRWLTLWLLTCIMCVGTGQTVVAGPDTNSAASLRAKYVELGQQLSNNQFKRSLYVVSAESSSRLKADIYALVEYRFATGIEALVDPEH